MKMAGSFSCDLCAIELKLKRDMLPEIAMVLRREITVSSCLCGLALAGGFPPALHMQAGRQHEHVIYIYIFTLIYKVCLSA